MEIKKKDLFTKLVSFRVTAKAHERCEHLKRTTTMDVNETLRLWFDEVLDHLESEAEKYAVNRSA